MSVEVAAASVDVSAFTGLALAIIALITAAIKWIASRDHSPRLAVLESDLEQVNDIVKGIQSKSGDITAVIAAIPQLQDYVNKNQEKITQLEQELIQAENAIKQLQVLVPEGTAIQAKALFNIQQQTPS